MAACLEGQRMSMPSASVVDASGWEYAADLAALDDDTPVTVDVNGVPVCLVRRGGRVHALLDVCSHQDYPLSQGEVTDDAIECCVHGACFDLSTGAAVTPPASEPVPVYPVQVIGGRVYVLVKERGCCG
jgi:3-phenylpropionate/trans-cinnamate dioxygenase ferredoxin component